MRISIVIFLTALLLSSAIAATPEEFPVKGFSFTQEITLPVSPDSAFDFMTGDISGWWDHSFSDNPKKLFIDRTPGGAYWEIFDDAGNGVKHATVIFADRGKKFRMEGPLGLSGRAFQGVYTYDYEAIPTGTKVTLTVNMLGQLDAEFAGVVQQVWNHFLVERLVPYVEKVRIK